MPPAVMPEILVERNAQPFELVPASTYFTYALTILMPTGYPLTVFGMMSRSQQARHIFRLKRSSPYCGKSIGGACGNHWTIDVYAWDADD